MSIEALVAASFFLDSICALLNHGCSNDDISGTARYRQNQVLREDGNIVTLAVPQIVRFMTIISRINSGELITVWCRRRRLMRP